MLLVKKSYKPFDVLRLVFVASPICAVLHIFLSVTQAVMSTAAMVLVTARFVDTATDILQSERTHDEIYMPLFLLLLVLGVFTTIGAVVQLIASRINLHLQRALRPALVDIHAALDFRHIENAKSWELISRVSRDPVGLLMGGFSAFMQLWMQPLEMPIWGTVCPRC